MVLLDVSLDGVDDSGGPFNDQGFQAILLVQVGIHILLESLFAHPVLLALFVELDLLRVNVHYGVLELLFGQDSVLCSADRRIWATLIINGARRSGCLRSLLLFGPHG